MEHLLFLVHRIPYPPNKGEKLRSFHLLKYLSSRYRVYLGTFVDDVDDWQHVEYLRSYCAETYFARLNPFVARMRSALALASGEALTVRYYQDDGLARWVESVVERHHIKHMIAFSSPMAQYLLQFQEANRLADMVDVDSAKWGQYVAKTQWPMSWLYRRESRTLLDFEKRIAATFDATVFVSAAEANLFRRLSGLEANRIHFAGNGVDTDYFSPNSVLPDPFAGTSRVLVFTGSMDYWPNVDAVKWFANEVFPPIRQTWPDARFAIVGARPSAEVSRLGAISGITVTGTVPDVRPYIAHATAVVAPLRIARGVQNKVLEGMAMGRTVIVSPGAAEGIEAVAGVDLLVAETPADYLDAVDSVFEGRCDLGPRAREKVLQSYSWEHNLGRMNSLLDERENGHESATCNRGAVAQA